jgi:8-oxo-dGTP pyrophosphatase MutT (NUDIX family)
MSPYVRELRARMGSALLLLPSVTALVFDDAGRLLLVRQRDGGVWSTPGGAMEPDETPADAMVREAWEETGLLVEPVRIAGVYGGSECVVRYPNGDETQYVMTVFACAVRGGALRADGDETLEARYVGAEEARALPLTPWLRHVISAFFERREAHFFPARWRPPEEPITGG